MKGYTSIRMNKKHNNRIAVFDIDYIIDRVFTREKRFFLKSEGFSYNSKEWKEQASQIFFIGTDKKLRIPMGSHRYQLFAEKGCKCAMCGIKGKFFALEKMDSDINYHFNLYALNPNGEEVMLTKDHIIPRSLGGKNSIDNYQTLCEICNGKKSNKLI